MPDHQVTETGQFYVAVDSILLAELNCNAETAFW